MPPCSWKLLPVAASADIALLPRCHSEQLNFWLMNADECSWNHTESSQPAPAVLWQAAAAAPPPWFHQPAAAAAVILQRILAQALCDGKDLTIDDEEMEWNQMSGARHGTQRHSHGTSSSGAWWPPHAQHQGGPPPWLPALAPPTARAAKGAREMRESAALESPTTSVGVTAVAAPLQSPVRRADTPAAL